MYVSPRFDNLAKVDDNLGSDEEEAPAALSILQFVKCLRSL
jgi:hypothetical protein